MESKIRVLEIINNGQIGGGPIHVNLILKSLNRNQFEPFCACSPSGDLIQVIQENSIEYFPVSIRKWPNVFSIYKLYRIIKKYQINIVHTHGGVAGLWGRFAAFLAGNVAIVHTLHGIHYLNYQNSLLKRILIYLERLLSAVTNVVICVAAADEKKIVKFKLAPSEKIRLIRCGIEFDSDNVSPTEIIQFRNSLGCTSETKLLVNVARLHRQKGQKYLLTAFKEVQQQMPGAKLVIVGDGPERRALEKFVQTQGLAEQVYFTGYRQDIQTILTATDLFVLSSLWEGLPLVIIEAMSQAKPIVATQVDGIPEIIESGKNGLLVPPGDSNQLAAAILRLIQHPALAIKLGEAARQKVLADYAIQYMIQKIEKLYVNMMKEMS